MLLIGAVLYEFFLVTYHRIYTSSWMDITASFWGIIIDALGIQDGLVLSNPCVNNPTWYISVLLLCYIIFYFDFYNFIELVQNHVVKMTGKDVIELSEIDTDNMDSLYYTMQLCAANGIFVAESDLIGENLDDEMLEDCDSVYGGIHYLKTKYCDVLLKYIEDVEQIIPCGKDML